MTIPIVSANNTFFFWLNQCNQSFLELNGIMVLGGAFQIANTSIKGPLFNIVSNSAGIVVIGNPASSNTVYITASVSIDPSDTSTSNLASSNIVNSNRNLIVSSFNQANTAYNVANNAIIDAQGAFLQANTAITDANQAGISANNAYGQANAAFNQANIALTTTQAAYARGNTSAQLAFSKANANGSLLTAGSNNDTITILSSQGISISSNTLNNSFSVSGTLDGYPILLVDNVTVSLNAAQGKTFILNAHGNDTIAIPSNPGSRQKITIIQYANNAAYTLSLNTSPGGFRFGTDITSLSVTTNNKTDYIGCIYNDFANYWDVVAVTKGFLIMISQVGLVYYLDDPEKKVFRKVYPTISDKELDERKWVTMGCDPKRFAFMEKVPIDSIKTNAPMKGTP